MMTKFSASCEFLHRFQKWAFPSPPWYGPPVYEPSYVKNQPFPRVSLEWLDSASINGGLWVDRDLISPNALEISGLKQRTVGYLIEQSDVAYLIAQSIGPDRLGAVLSIPKVSVVAFERWA
jgi:hypothetical protein